MKIKLIVPVLICIVTVVIYAAGQSEGKIEVTGVAGDDAGEIVVTLSEPDRPLLAGGDALRKGRDFDRAIAAYEKVLNDDTADIEIKKEAQYNIGLCRIEQGKYEIAVELFNNMLDTCADNGNAVAHVQYCLAWIEVQQEAFDSAIVRLEQTLESKKCTDRELCARTQFMIGRIYLSFLNDYTLARVALEKVLAEYPDTKIAGHPYLKRK